MYQHSSWCPVKLCGKLYIYGRREGRIKLAKLTINGTMNKQQNNEFMSAIKFCQKSYTNKATKKWFTMSLITKNGFLFANNNSFLLLSLHGRNLDNDNTLYNLIVMSCNSRITILVFFIRFVKFVNKQHNKPCLLFLYEIKTEHNNLVSRCNACLICSLFVEINDKS